MPTTFLSQSEKKNETTSTRLPLAQKKGKTIIDKHFAEQ